MADATGTTGSITSIVSFGLALATTLHAFVEAVHEPKDRLREIVFDLNSTAAALTQLQIIFDSEPKEEEIEKHNDELTKRPGVFTPQGREEIMNMAVQCEKLYTIIVVLMTKAGTSSGAKGKVTMASVDTQMLKMSAMRGLRRSWLGPRMRRCQEQLRWLKMSLLFNLQLATLAQFQLSSVERVPGGFEEEMILRSVAERLRRQRLKVTSNLAEKTKQRENKSTASNSMVSLISVASSIVILDRNKPKGTPVTDHAVLSKTSIPLEAPKCVGVGKDGEEKAEAAPNSNAAQPLEFQNVGLKAEENKSSDRTSCKNGTIASADASANSRNGHPPGTLQNTSSEVNPALNLPKESILIPEVIKDAQGLDKARTVRGAGLDVTPQSIPKVEPLSSIVEEVTPENKSNNEGILNSDERTRGQPIENQKDPLLDSFIQSAIADVKLGPGPDYPIANGKEFETLPLPAFESKFSSILRKLFGRRDRFTKDWESQTLEAFILLEDSRNVKVPFGHQRLAYGLKEMKRKAPSQFWEPYLALHPQKHESLGRVLSASKAADGRDRTCLGFEFLGGQNMSDKPLLVFISLGPSLEPVQVNDCLGRKIIVPFHLGTTSKGVKDLLTQAFVHVETVGQHVEEGHYDLLTPTGDYILPSAWKTLVKPGMVVTMQLWPMAEPFGTSSSKGLSEDYYPSSPPSYHRTAPPLTSAAQKKSINDAVSKVKTEIESKLRAEMVSKALLVSAAKEKKPLRFKDAVGRKFNFPFHMVQTWVGMEKLIRQAFLHVEVLGPHVQRGFYDLLGPDGSIILPMVWDVLVEPDWPVSMHMWPMSELIQPPPLPRPQGFPRPQGLPPPGFGPQGGFGGGPRPPQPRGGFGPPGRRGPPGPPPPWIGPPPTESAHRRGPPPPPAWCDEEIVIIEDSLPKRTKKSGQSGGRFGGGSAGKVDSSARKPWNRRYDSDSDSDNSSSSELESDSEIEDEEGDLGIEIDYAKEEERGKLGLGDLLGKLTNAIDTNAEPFETDSSDSDSDSGSSLADD